jgi:hypothetical protein
MKTFFFSFDMNLANDQVREMALKSGLVSEHNMNMNTTSRPFLSYEECCNVMQADINLRLELISKSKRNDSKILSTITETNPALNNSVDELAAARAANLELDDYMHTWAASEMTRVTLTTEDFDDEDQYGVPPILNEEEMIFQYVIYRIDDDFTMPADGFTPIFCSTMIH